MAASPAAARGAFATVNSSRDETTSPTLMPSYVATSATRPGHRWIEADQGRVCSRSGPRFRIGSERLLPGLRSRLSPSIGQGKISTSYGPDRQKTGTSHMAMIQCKECGERGLGRCADVPPVRRLSSRRVVHDRVLPAEHDGLRGARGGTCGWQTVRRSPSTRPRSGPNQPRRPSRRSADVTGQVNSGDRLRDQWRDHR